MDSTALRTESTTQTASTSGTDAALRAWSIVRPGAAMPDRIDTFKEKSRSAAYRLHTPDLGPIVAKRCLRQSAHLEELVYREILPAALIPSLRYFGCVDDEAGECCWLFMEDAGGELYRRDSQTHAALAARWLAAMNCGAASVITRFADQLPDRGPRHYQNHLLSARARLLECISNPALTLAHIEILAEVIEQCYRIEQFWNRIEEVCTGTPKTLVHCDFVPKNLRVRTGSNAPLAVFDWEWAGIGVPAADVGECDDFDTYAASVDDRFATRGRDRLGRLRTIGRVFRWLASVDWASLHLAYEWVERPMEGMMIFRDAMRSMQRDLEEG